MIWETKKTLTALINDNDEINFTFRVPTSRDYEELSEEGGSNRSFLKRFLLSVDGFSSIDDFIECPGTMGLQVVMVKAIGDSAQLNARLKN